MKNVGLCIISFILFVACEPRIKMDLEQWGDHAYIDNVEVIKLDTDEEAKLQEYYQNETPMEVTGIRNVVVSVGTAVIDSVGYVAKVKVKKDVDLKYAGVRIYHKCVLVEPVNGTPKAGIVTDLSEKELVYRLNSADGSRHDWKIIIEKQ